MLVIGGGIIGLEMACVYDALGAKVTIAEFSDGLIPAADRDVVQPLLERIRKRYEAIYTNTRVSRLEENGDRLTASFEGQGAPKESGQYDLVLVAVGRRPNGKLIGAEKRVFRSMNAIHTGQPTTADERAAYLCHRRYLWRAHAGTPRPVMKAK